jgi:hypothetical protein
VFLDAGDQLGVCQGSPPHDVAKRRVIHAPPCIEVCAKPTIAQCCPSPRL